MNRFSSACKDFGLTISVKKTKVLEERSGIAPVITIDGQVIESVNNFVYLGSNISSSGSINSEIDRRIGKASGTFARLSDRVWCNPKLSIKTKASVYNACVCSTLLYGSEG